jgi:hypothetical protein
MANHGKSKRKERLVRSSSASPPKQRKDPPVDLDELWLRVRSGAANVAGVRYQLAVTVYLLAGARASLGITELSPEGLEDIDCRLAGGERLLVQAKERAGGDARLGPSELRAAIEHVAEALRIDSRARFVLVTDAALGGGLAETGFGRSVAEVTPEAAGAMTRPSEAHEGFQLALLRRVHIACVGWAEVHAKARRLLEESYELLPAVAAIVHAMVLDQVAGAAADQRGTTRDAARSFRPVDLDAFVQQIREVADPEQLTLVEREGLVEPLDFTRPLQLPLERFLLGIDVEPGHIAAGLDVLRAGELEQIFAGLHDDHYVLIAGPSGAGKSALLWRAAYQLGGRFRLLRLRRLDSPHVADLLRYLEAQRPSLQAPILICGDNLGRPAVAAWEDAVDQLLELPGVYVLGAVREEDFRASLQRGRAQVVRPTLSKRLADELVAQLERRRVPFAVEPSEALARADGLLMEFVALLASGRRLRDIVQAQVEQRLAPERMVEREILRYVAAAHVYTLDLPAAALATLVPAPEEMPAALQRLEDEFLVRRASADHWRGLHELRSRVVTTRLHELPPPSEAETVGRLLPVLDGPDRRTLIVAVGLAGLELSPVVAAAAEVLAAGAPDAAAIFALLDGFIEAEELRHARACLEFVRRQAPEQDAVGVLPLLQVLRDGGIRPLAGLPNGAALDALAASLPARPPSIAAEVAGRISEQVLLAAVTSSPISRAVELVELLAFLGRSLPVQAAPALIGRARTAGATELMTRAVAAVVRTTPECVPQLDRLAGSLEVRLDAIAELRRDVLRWELGNERKTAIIAAAEHGEGKLNDRLVGICRLVYECCPEVEQVSVQALAADGSRSSLPDAKKSPARRYVLNPIREIRRNLAFQDALCRLTAADSWSTRLRRQEDLVREIAAALEDSIPRLLSPYDNASRRRSWCEAVDRARQAADRLPAVPLPPSSAVDRSDQAKALLGQLSHALTQLARAVFGDRFDNLLGMGSQFQAALDEVPAGGGAVIVDAEARNWPIVQRLLGQVDALRDISDLVAGLLLALHHDRTLLRRVRRSGTETWRMAAVRVVADTRERVLQEERDALEQAVEGIPCELRLMRRPRPGKVRLVSDLWLVVCGLEHHPRVSEGLLRLAEEMQLALSFRTYLLCTICGLVIPAGAKRFGHQNSKPYFYPVHWDDATALAKEAQIAYLSSAAVEGVRRAMDMIVRASSAAAGYRLRDTRFSREPERLSAGTAIEAARGAIAEVGDPDARTQLAEALRLVEGELDGPEGDSLAGEIQQAIFKAGPTAKTRASRLNLAFAVVTSKAALEHGGPEQGLSSTAVAAAARTLRE